MDDQLEGITSIIQKYNIAKEINVDGSKETHIPLSYEDCMECAKLIRAGHKYYKDGSRIGIMNADKALTDLRLIKEYFKKSDELFDGLPLTIKMPFNNRDINNKLGLLKYNDSAVSHFKNMIADFNEVYDLLKLNASEKKFKKSKVDTEMLAIMNGAVNVWRLHLLRKTPKYINRGNKDDEFSNYLDDILKKFDLKKDIDHSYRTFIKWKKGEL